VEGLNFKKTKLNINGLWDETCVSTVLTSVQKPPVVSNSTAEPPPPVKVYGQEGQIQLLKI